jgi:2-polyprenyl-3-methyl-5-hydroxy-6-metoxy-1,4-benzoquinol methylase
LSREPHEPVRVVGVGSHGGDLLRQIAVWAQRRGIAVKLTGIDLNPYATRTAAESTPKKLGIEWLTGDALEYRPKMAIDIVVSSLMMHHLEDEEIIARLRWMEATAQARWFINDLERSEWICTAFELVAGLLRWHRFVRHDGPVSYRRDFGKEDWTRLLKMAGIPQEAVTVEH